MSAWRAKRFWDSVSVSEAAQGFAVLLDGRAVKTPAKKPFVVPSQALAAAIAAEWEAQEEILRPDLMPLTRMANTALDQLPAQRAAVIAELVRYGGSDLLCYRASHPEKLRRAQAEEWDPLLEWLAAQHGVRLIVTEGVMPVAQPEAAQKLPSILSVQSDFAIVALSEMAALSGSLVLALAAAEGWAAPEALFERGRLDERVQAEDWGQDDEAMARASNQKSAFVSACSLITLSRKL